MGCPMSLKINFPLLPSNLGAMSDEHAERVSTKKLVNLSMKTVQGRWGVAMLDY